MTYVFYRHVNYVSSVLIFQLGFPRIASLFRLSTAGLKNLMEVTINKQIKMLYIKRIIDCIVLPNIIAKYYNGLCLTLKYHEEHLRFAAGRFGC